jgi:outer membrane protein insertion porin family
VRRIAFALLLLVWLASPAAAEVIRQIVVEDNTKTTDDTVIFIARVSRGDDWDPSLVDVIKQRLVSSGLFKDVEVYWTPIAGSDGGVKLHILAKDKHSWVIAPAFYNQPTNVGGGIGFGENNLFGQNQKLLLYGQIATQDSFFIGAWLLPSIANTRFYGQLDTFLRSSRQIEYAPPRSYLVDGPAHVYPVRESRVHYLNVGGRIGFEVLRGLRIDTRLRGANVSFHDVKLLSGDPGDVGPGTDPDNLPAPGQDGWDVSNENSITLDRRANWYGVQSGHRYRFVFEHALPSLGSDFIYWQTTASVFKAYKLLERHNFIAQANFNYGRNLPFQQEFLTGGTSMRGWLNWQFRGNLRTIANLEYSVPVMTIKGFSMRALGFFDSAYTTFTRTREEEAKRHYLPGSHVRGLDGFKNSIGVGTRFYLRQIVLPLLGLDVGYGLESRDVQVYLAIGLTD